MSFQKLSIACALVILLCGCNQNNNLQLEGQIDYVGSAEIFISKQPVHYKYAEKKTFPVSPDEEGSFSLTIPVDSSQLIHFNVDDQSYPLIAEPDQDLTLNIQRSQFPHSVEVEGYAEPWDSLLTQYRKAEQSLLRDINQQIAAFREGEHSRVPDIYQQRYELAEQHLKDTPLQPVYYKAVGEYLVKRLEELQYRRNNPEVTPQEVREEIVQEAKQLNFFSFESLHAQRAGSRDFTNAYANTFGVADSLEEEYDQELMQYDVKRLGYETLDSARTSVLSHIKERRAKAYARMHLVAERIGEMPLEVASPSYKQYLQDYEGDFPEYTALLRTFYEQIERVSPGQPAIPFTIPDQEGNPVAMEDFRGKYVLLDFWASWCIPCLDEFPYMKQLYNRYSREDFEIAAISLEEDSLRWRQAIQRFDNPWPQLYGGEGFQQETFEAYRGGGIPFYILVGPDGNILRYNDVRPSFNLEQVLDSLINSKT